MSLCGAENLEPIMLPRFGYWRSSYHLFKLIRRFLFGNTPFFLQSSTSHLSAACGFSENGGFRFLFRCGASRLGNIPFLRFAVFAGNGSRSGAAVENHSESYSAPKKPFFPLSCEDILFERTLDVHRIPGLRRFD